MSLAQLSQLLPLPDEDLQQVLDYAQTLSKPEAASHLSNLLGDSPLAVDFIASFNSRRSGPVDAAPKGKRAPPRELKAAAAAEVEASAGPSTGAGYSKRHGDANYTAASSSRARPAAAAGATRPGQKAKQQASSAGFLISDVASKARTKARSNPSPRSSRPRPSGANATTKVSIAGGTQMAGQSTALADLDAAIRALQVTENASAEGGKRRKCSCVATRHPLQSAAPNCLACGKVICVREGLGPCTFCGAALLEADQVQAMMRELKGERGRERMAADAAANRRADVSKKAAASARRRGSDAAADDGSLADAAAKAREHRDKLLSFQAQKARRTTVRDEAADFDAGQAMMSGSGSAWASPSERARELKRQQKLMREMEWKARPDYEKRKQVLSIDLVGGKVVRRMAAIERPATPPSDEDEGEGDEAVAGGGSSRSGGGAFGGNPLLGALLRPVYEPKDGRGRGRGGTAEGSGARSKAWRRVQDDLDDNEGVILDGGAYGHGGVAGDEAGRG